VTTTWINVLTPEQKEEQRKELAKQVEEYLANGGKITQCPRNAFTETDVEGKPKRKFDRLITPDSLTDPTNRDVGAYRPPFKGSKD
jgi:ribosome recycling factor